MDPAPRYPSSRGGGRAGFIPTGLCPGPCRKPPESRRLLYLAWDFLRYSHEMKQLFGVFVLWLSLLGVAIAEPVPEGPAIPSPPPCAEKTYKEWVESLTRAYLLTANPKILFNLGRCAHNLDKKEDAITYYQKYLQALPEAPNREDVKKWIEEIKASLPPASAPAEAKKEKTTSSGCKEEGTKKTKERKRKKNKKAKESSPPCATP